MFDRSEFDRHRERLLPLARRWVDSAAEAEDILSEAWLRWAQAPEVRNHGAFLSIVVTRLCADHLKSARARRECYVGAWPPEPAKPDRAQLGPQETVERDEDLFQVALHLLELLSPGERAVLVLRQGFDYSYREIAGVLQIGEAYCRQLYVRARTRLASGNARFTTEPEKRLELTNRLLAASRAGELRQLERLLAADMAA
jgi:RNA polymerase sigma factor (sigma-70 family)